MMTAVKELTKFRDAVLDKGGDLQGADISRMIIKAAAYMSILGEEVAAATKEANTAYAFRKFRTATEFKRIRIELDKTIGDAKEMALEEVFDIKEQEILRQYEADALKTFYDDISRLIMTMQSRLKVLDRQAQLDSKAT